jgi:hypothetical protein
VASGILSPIVLFILGMAARDLCWGIALGGVSAAAFALPIPVLLRGNSWQKRIAALLLFVPSFGLVAAALGAASFF